MKRTALKRSSQLLRRKPLRSRPKPPIIEPGSVEFKEVREGICRVCGKRGLVRRHHVLTEQRVRRAGGNPWDKANGLWVGVEGVTCQCHPNHHSAAQRIPIELVTVDAMAFAVDLLGEHGAAYYFHGHYRGERSTA